jgi:hypothetical protein
MVDTREQIKQHLATLIGLDLSGAGRAADMLTLQFGPVREMTTKRGSIKHVGAWALHIQCDWKIERASEVFASAPDFVVSDENTHATLERIRRLIADDGPFTVEGIAVGEDGNVSISMSRQLQFSIVTDGAPDEEDWRFFEPGANQHFVIEGGKVAPESFS